MQAALGFRCAFLIAVVAGSLLSLGAAEPDPLVVASEVDQAIEQALQEEGTVPAAVAGDAELLRRASLDITGKLPSPDAVTMFALDPDPGKRTRVLEQLISSPDYARNWARYWRDAIFYRALDARSQAMGPVRTTRQRALPSSAPVSSFRW